MDLPVLQGIVPVRKKQVPLDIIAGITLAALAIPEVMGYAKIAGMPIVTGLYTLLIPMALFAILGSSRHLVVGADSATAAIIATTLVTTALPGSHEYIAFAGIIALLSAGFLFLSRIFQLGFIADFLSRSALIGFLTGVGIQVALGQVPGMFGVSNETNNSILTILHIFTNGITFVNGINLLLSILVLSIIFLGDRIYKKIPWALLTIIGAIVASWAFRLQNYGVATIGNVPGGLPVIAFPVVPVGQMSILLSSAAACFLVILAQSGATSRAYALRYNEKFDENVDLVGLGFANLAAGLSGTFVVNGSPTKTEMVDSAGGRTQLAQVVTVGIVLLVLLYLTEPLSYLPGSVLAVIVFMIGIRLIDINGMKSILDRRPVEFIVAFFTTLTVVFINVGWGVIFAIVISVIVHLRHSYRPSNYLMFKTSDGEWRSAPLESGTQALPGLAIYRFSTNLYYANEGRFSNEIVKIMKEFIPSLKWLCICGSSINDIDYSGSESLKQLYTELKKIGVVLVLSEIDDHVKQQLERDKYIEMIGYDHIFDSNNDVLLAFGKTK